MPSAFQTILFPASQARCDADDLLQEFPARDLAYYEAAFADGRLRVSGGFVGLHDPLCNGMTIHHYLHRHEPPVLDIAIPVSSYDMNKC